MDYYSELISAGMTISDLEYARQDADRKGIDYDTYLSILYNDLQDNKTIEQIKTENHFPSFYDEDRNGDLIQGKYTYGNLAECYQSFNPIELVEAVQYIYTDNYTAVDRAKAETLLLTRAQEIQQITAIRTVIKEVKANYIKSHSDTIEYPIPADLLRFTKNGEVKPTIENFRVIMENDPFYNGGAPTYTKVFYNVISNRAEIHTFTAAGELVSIRNWEEADYSASMEHIESTYSLYNKEKHDSALAAFWKSRIYNPITLQLDALRGTWDGVERCADFLTVWGRAASDDYTRAVSRMIFDGAVARAYKPGVKFDDVPVLTGKQGSGKSALCTFVAINDLYHGSMATFDRKEQVNCEKLEGKWIVELEELVTKKDIDFQSRLKAFISSTIDTYRKPYSRGVSDLPRRCIMIGTTNHESFLSDLTGNRRFYPVPVRCQGRYLYQHEQEIRDYILKCYAEAVSHYDNKDLLTVFPESLVSEAEARQADAMQPNFIFDTVMAFIDRLKVGEQFYIRKILLEELYLTPKDVMADKRIEQDIVSILRNCEYVVKVDRKRVKGMASKQTIYEKINPNLPPID